MNDDQKKAAADRLAAAREKRFAKNPPAYAQYSQAVVALPDEDDFSMKNVRAWIKEAKAHKLSEHRSHLAGTNGALARRETWNSYIGQLENYLRTGGYSSMFAGGDMEKRVSKYCIAAGISPMLRLTRLYHPAITHPNLRRRCQYQRQGLNNTVLHYLDTCRCPNTLLKQCRLLRNRQVDLHTFQQ